MTPTGLPPAIDALWRRPDTFRLFALFEGVATDEKGNARSGRAYQLGSEDGFPAWIPWQVGDCLHWHPFRVALLSTRRAGLHVLTEWRQGEGERRYGANHQVTGDGVLVLTPFSVMSAAEPLDDAMESPVEAAHLEAVLLHRFGFPATARSRADMLPRLRRIDRIRTGPGHARDRHPQSTPIERRA
jgi:hypothetical protein